MAYPTWDDVVRIEGLISSPKAFKIEVIEVFGPAIYEDVYSKGHRTTSEMARELRRRMIQASARKPVRPVRPRRIGKDAAARNDD